MFVSGLLALILEAKPGLLQPNADCIGQVKSALMNSAVPLNDEIDHDARWGYGAIDGNAWLEEIESSVVCE